MKIVYNTEHYKRTDFEKYIVNALSFVPEKDLKGIANLNVYDSCPSHYPISAKGGFYPATKNRGAVIELYIDENLGHMMSYHSAFGYLTKLSDTIFVKLFGKKFIVHTLLHEIGHAVDNKVKKRKNKRREERYADDYANAIYRKIFSLSGVFYNTFNNFYRIVYRKRIEHDNVCGQQSCVNKKKKKA